MHTPKTLIRLNLVMIIIRGEMLAPLVPRRPREAVDPTLAYHGASIMSTMRRAVCSMLSWVAVAREWPTSGAKSL
ncbi:MAG: hypothetical protein ACI8P0_001330 [Planctomycetaceae bacterium]|jgi:hypothetical protein